MPSVFLLPESVIKTIVHFYHKLLMARQGMPCNALEEVDIFMSPKMPWDMDFLDLHAFNLALLAKQAWKLITKKAHSLFAWVVKDKHFPSTEVKYFAKLGIFYVWRMLLANLKLLRHGTRRRVGTSLSIQAW